MSTVPTIDDPIAGLAVDVREITTTLNRIEAAVDEALETGADTSSLSVKLHRLSGSVHELLGDLDGLLA